MSDLRQKSSSYRQEISDLQEALQWKEKKIAVGRCSCSQRQRNQNQNQSSGPGLNIWSQDLIYIQSDASLCYHLSRATMIG